MRKILIALLLFSSNHAHALAVATANPFATETAIDVLRHGGNAVDAMVAATFVLNVAQPYNTGIGGGGFILAAKNGAVSAWDSREMAPSSAHDKMFLDSDGKPLNYYPDKVTGPNPVGVPGLALGLWEAHRKLGSKPWKQLLQPAIKLARGGFPISGKFAEVLEGNWERISKFPTTAALFGDGHGSHLIAGQVFRNPLLAQTLEQIAARGAPEFYTGRLASSWIEEARKFGVKITFEDLKKYKVRAVKPIEYKVFGLRALTVPPPSGAGLAVAGPLRYLEHYYHSHDLPDADSAARVIVTTEALKHFQDLRTKNIGDAGYSKIDPAKFLGSPEEKAAWAEIDKRVAARLEHITTAVTMFRPAPEPEGGHTSHMSIIDDRGMAVSYTSTIEEIFGSGIVVTGHGFLLNDELSDFTSEPGHPNSAAPFKRPRSNMSPHLLYSGASLVGTVGCAGGGMIPTVISETLENYFLHKMSARAALAAVRFQPSGDKLLVEKSMRGDVVEKLKDADYNIETRDVFGYKQTMGGTGQALLRRTPKDRWEAASEPRSDGLGIVLD